MTVIESPTKWPTPTVEPTPAFDVAWHTLDYIKRIHWWVRLFGIVWIVIPILLTLASIVFVVGGLSLSAANS